MKKLLLSLSFLLICPFVFAQDSTINGYDYTSAEMLEFNGISGTPSASLTGKAKVYFDNSSGKLKCSQNGSSYADCIGASGTSGWIDGGSNVYNVNTSDSVAIGTTTPLYPLHVKGPMVIEGTPTPRLYAKSNDGGNSLVFNRYSGQEAYDMFFGENADTGDAFFRGQGGFYFGDQSNPAIFASGSSQNAAIGYAGVVSGAKLRTYNRAGSFNQGTINLTATIDTGIGSNYLAGDNIEYRVSAYKIIGGVIVRCSDPASTSIVLSNDTDSVIVEWDDVSGVDGYIIERNLNSGGFSYYVNTGTSAIYDADELGFWTSGSIFDSYDTALTRDVYYNYYNGSGIYDVSDTDGYARFNKGSFNSTVAIGTTSTSSTMEVRSVDSSSSTLLVNRSNGSLGTSDTLTPEYSHLVLKNPSGGQSMLVFTDGSDNVWGGVRADSAANFNWHSAGGYHAFFTSNSAGYATTALALALVGNGAAIGPTSGNSTQFVKNKFDVWGAASIGYTSWGAMPTAPTNGLAVNGALVTGGNVGIGTTSTDAALTIPALKSTTGTKYLCINTSGKVISSASACSGT